MGAIGDTGKKNGEASGNEGVQLFCGILSADPPPGGLRFCTPQPAEPWARTHTVR
jgi:carboxylesterase type B